MTNNNNGNELGGILKQRRVMIPLTLRELGATAGMSASYLGRVERGERFPSALVLRKIAQPLSFDESELFLLAGYLSPQSARVEEGQVSGNSWQLDPYTSRMLGQEPVEVQRSVIGILAVLKGIAKAL